MLNVRDYGAVGDGVSDDTAALTALFGRIGAGGVREVYFPAGKYLHTGLTIKGASGFTIRGPGELVAANRVVTEYLRLLDCSDFTIKGLSSRHENPTERRLTSPARAFSLENCTRFHVSKCHAHHGEGVGIMLWHCSHATVDNNLVQWTKADGIGLYGDTHHVTVTGNATHETGDDGIAQVGVLHQGVLPHDNTVVGNTVSRSWARGIVAVGAYSSTISGNTIDVTRAGGIYVTSEPTRGTYGCKDIIVSANTVRDANTWEPDISQAGIFIFGGEQTVERVTVTGNTVTGSRTEGIRVGGTGEGTRLITVSGNMVTDSGSDGIALWTVQHVQATGNTVATTGGHGIRQGAGATGAVLVERNTVIDAGREGVKAPGGVGADRNVVV